MSSVVLNSVDVLIAGAAVEDLRPPHRSMVAGGSEPVSVRARVLGRPLRRRREVSLTVDRATAARLARANRRQAIWNRWVFPAWCVIAVAMFADAQYAVLGGALDAISSMLAFACIIGVFVTMYVFDRLASPLHPRWQGRSVLVRGVDQAAAEEWRGLNSPESLRIRA